MAKKPDWKIRALNKHTEAQGEIGAAWNDERGHISLVFNPFVTVPTGKEYIITLFPIKRDEKGEEVQTDMPF